MSILRCDDFKVQDYMVAYNIFMNSVDVMDQYVKVEGHKQPKLCNKIFNYILLWEVNNSYYVYIILYRMGHVKVNNVICS